MIYLLVNSSILFLFFNYTFIIIILIDLSWFIDKMIDWLGKESNIYVVGGPDGDQRCLKLHRLGRTCFRFSIYHSSHSLFERYFLEHSLKPRLGKPLLKLYFIPTQESADDRLCHVIDSY